MHAGGLLASKCKDENVEMTRMILSMIPTMVAMTMAIAMVMLLLLLLLLLMMMMMMMMMIMMILCDPGGPRSEST